MGKVALVVEFRTRPELREQWEALMRELAAGVATEEGNLVYTVSKSKTEPGLYHVLEVYASAEAVEAHKAAPHAKAALGQLKNFLTAPPVIVASDVVASTL